jgi:hypothetical protein
MSIIEVNHVTKEYQLGTMQSLKTTALNQWRRLTGQPVQERAPFKALDDVSFNIEAGEVVGITFAEMEEFIDTPTSAILLACKSGFNRVNLELVLKSH